MLHTDEPSPPHFCIPCCTSSSSPQTLPSWPPRPSRAPASQPPTQVGDYDPHSTC
uniref:Uncharacterized protein n=1 Tax=Arundo donax TaxID=35708 RepID=A0A0A9ECW1_ARUDO